MHGVQLKISEDCGGGEMGITDRGGRFNILRQERSRGLWGPASMPEGSLERQDKTWWGLVLTILYAPFTCDR